MAHQVKPFFTFFPPRFLLRRVTKCNFHKYGPSGTIEKHDAMCVLALNIINEKIYVFLWFWFIILAILTSLYFLYVLSVIALPSMRKIMVERNAKGDLKVRGGAQQYSNTHSVFDYILGDMPCLFWEQIEDITDKSSSRSRGKSDKSHEIE